MDNETRKRYGREQMVKTPDGEQLIHSKPYMGGILVKVETCGQEQTRVLVIQGGMLVKTVRFEGQRRVQKSIDFGERYARQPDEEEEVAA